MTLKLVFLILFFDCSVYLGYLFHPKTGSAFEFVKSATVYKCTAHASQQKRTNSEHILLNICVTEIETKNIAIDFVMPLLSYVFFSSIQIYLRDCGYNMYFSLDFLFIYSYQCIL